MKNIKIKKLKDHLQKLKNIIFNFNVKIIKICKLNFKKKMLIKFIYFM